MTFIKKPLYFQNINPRTIFTILIWLIIAWILARPLHGIGENIYVMLGSATNNISQKILNVKSETEELLKSKKSLKEQSQIISTLKVKINYLEDQINEVKNLKGILNLKKNISYKTNCANLIGRSADNWHKQIILDKGRNFNLMVGDAVLSKNGIVGQIVEVTKGSSVVQLISDPSYRIGCKIKNKNIIGILSGKTNLVSLLEFIPIGTNVKVGDIVVTSGIRAGNLAPVYPLGHLIGRISKISKKKSKASDLYIEVKLQEDLSRLSEVLVFSPD